MISKRTQLFFSLSIVLIWSCASFAWESERRLTIEHWSEALQKPARFTVLLPGRSDAEAKYPVLYLLHGAWGNHTDWVERTDLAKETLGEEMIIVMPDGGPFGWYVDSPVDATSAYETYMTRDLITLVDRILPTMAHREGRAIAGLSMGGHGAVSLAAKHPDLFGSASSLSGILDITAHPHKWQIEDRLGSWEENPAIWKRHSALYLAERFVDADVALFFDSGREDETGAFQDSRAFHEKLVELDIEHTWIEREGAHTWEYWNEHLREHLAFHAERFLGGMSRGND